MKTQISNLINGMQNVRRDMLNEKYVGASRATSHDGFAGTNRKVREAIAARVIEENPDKLNLEMFGKGFELVASHSRSGNLNAYECGISHEDFLLVKGSMSVPYTHECCFTLCVNADMTVCVHKFTRRTEFGEWKHRGVDYIDESFVKIL